MSKYRKYVFKGEETKIESLDWNDAKSACSNSETADGLDIWTKKALRMLSDEGFKWITKWMQQIEDNRA